MFIFPAAISGIKDDNAPAFNKAEGQIKFAFRHQANLQIVNPIKLSCGVKSSFEDLSKVLKKNIEPDWTDYMRRCISELANCTHILFLDGWPNSRGATTEFYIAKALEIPCYFSLLEMQEKILA